jgi:hypothetical protein
MHQKHFLELGRRSTRVTHGPRPELENYDIVPLIQQAVYLYDMVVYRTK